MALYFVEHLVTQVLKGTIEAKWVQSNKVKQMISQHFYQLFLSGFWNLDSKMTQFRFYWGNQTQSAKWGTSLHSIPRGNHALNIQYVYTQRAHTHPYPQFIWDALLWPLHSHLTLCPIFSSDSLRIACHRFPSVRDSDAQILICPTLLDRQVTATHFEDSESRSLEKLPRCKQLLRCWQENGTAASV